MTVRSSRFPACLLVACLIAVAPVPFDVAQAQQNNNFFGNLVKPPGQVKPGGSAPAGFWCLFALIRLKRDGCVVTRFDGDGRVTSLFGGVTRGFALAFLWDG